MVRRGTNCGAFSPAGRMSPMWPAISQTAAPSIEDNKLPLPKKKKKRRSPPAPPQLPSPPPPPPPPPPKRSNNNNNNSNNNSVQSVMETAVPACQTGWEPKGTCTLKKLGKNSVTTTEVVLVGLQFNSYVETVKSEPKFIENVKTRTGITKRIPLQKKTR